MSTKPFSVPSGNSSIPNRPKAGKSGLAGFDYVGYRRKKEKGAIQWEKREDVNGEPVVVALTDKIDKDDGTKLTPHENPLREREIVFRIEHCDRVIAEQEYLKGIFTELLEDFTAVKEGE